MNHSARMTTHSSPGRWRQLVARALVSVALLSVLLVGLTLVYPYPENFTGFPRLTHTASGVAGDPINLILIGSQAQLAQSFHQAGWLVPDPITRQTVARIAAASLAHQPYPTAPISPLYAFGRPQDLAFEKPTSDVQNRDHVRLWLTETRFDGQAVWVAQASSDHGIELSASNLLPTHHIAPAVDRERALIGADLQRTGLVNSEALIAFASPVLYARNAGGDFYETDGDALLINFTTAPVLPRPSAWVIEGLKMQIFLLDDALVSLPLWIVVGLAVGAALVLGVAVAWLVRDGRRSQLTAG